MVPSPCPSWPCVRTIQGALLLAVHAHSRAIVTGTVPVPPVALNEAVGAPSVGWQRVEDGAVTLSVVSVELPHAEVDMAIAAATMSREVARMSDIGLGEMHKVRQPQRAACR